MKLLKKEQKKDSFPGEYLLKYLQVFLFLSWRLKGRPGGSILMFRQRRLTRFIVILLAAAFFCASASLSAADDEGQIYVENEWNFVDGSMNAMRGIPDDATGVLDRIRRKGVLRVGTEPYYAPQEFIDPDLTGQDQYVGADMELARLIAERMGVELIIVPMEYTEN